MAEPVSCAIISGGTASSTVGLDRHFDFDEKRRAVGHAANVDRASSGPASRHALRGHRLVIVGKPFPYTSRRKNIGLVLPPQIRRRLSGFCSIHPYILQSNICSSG